MTRVLTNGVKEGCMVKNNTILGGKIVLFLARFNGKIYFTNLDFSAIGMFQVN